MCERLSMLSYNSILSMYEWVWAQCSNNEEKQKKKQKMCTSNGKTIYDRNGFTLIRNDFTPESNVLMAYVVSNRVADST